MTSASGACPSVMMVTISRLSTYKVSGCSPAIEVGTISPRSLYASTSKVAGFAARVSCGPPFSFLSAANVRHLHLAQLRRLAGTDLGVAVGAALPNCGDLISDRLVARAAAQQRFQGVARLREEAGESRTLGGKAH